MAQNEWYIFCRVITHQQRHEARSQFIAWVEHLWPFLVLGKRERYAPHNTQHVHDSVCL